MSQQAIRQQARRTAREVGERRRRERAARERRLTALAEELMIAIGERDAAVAAAEGRAGQALLGLTEVEGLSLVEAVEWCGGVITRTDAARLRKLADRDPAASPAGESNQSPDPASVTAS